MPILRPVSLPDAGKPGGSKVAISKGKEEVGDSYSSDQRIHTVTWLHKDSKLKERRRGLHHEGLEI